VEGRHAADLVLGLVGRGLKGRVQTVMLPAGCCLQVAACRLLPAGCCLQVAACRLLPAGCCLQVAACMQLHDAGACWLVEATHECGASHPCGWLAFGLVSEQLARHGLS